MSKQVVDITKQNFHFSWQHRVNWWLTAHSAVGVCGSVVEGDFKREFCFCKTFDTTASVQNILEVVSNFFKANGLGWENVVVHLRSGFQALVKRCAPWITFVYHCFIQGAALASKPLRYLVTWALYSKDWWRWLIIWKGQQGTARCSEDYERTLVLTLVCCCSTFLYRGCLQEMCSTEYLTWEKN